MPGWFGFHFQFLYVPKFCVPGHGSYHSYQLQAKSATERQVHVDHVGIQLTRLAIMGIELEILEEKRYDIIYIYLYIYTSQKINGCLQRVFLCVLIVLTIPQTSLVCLCLFQETKHPHLVVWKVWTETQLCSHHRTNGSLVDGTGQQQFAEPCFGKQGVDWT